jgi:hypothetical protein
VAVDVQLRVANRGLWHEIVAAHCVDPASRREHREIQPIAPVDWQLRQLPRVDIGCVMRLRDVDEWRRTSNVNGLLNRCGVQLQVQLHLLSDQYFETVSCGRREPLKLCCHVVDARPNRYLINAPRICHAFEDITRRFMNCRDGGAGKRATRGICHCSSEHRLLSLDGNRQHHAESYDRADDDSPNQGFRSHELSSEGRRASDEACGISRSCGES